MSYSYGGRSLLLGWQQDVSGDEIAHVMSVRKPKTSLESEDSRQLQLRVACHYLLDLVSDRGLPEVLDHLKENLEFYSSRETFEVESAPSQTTVPAKLGLRYHRPTFQLVEE